jgi:hypothetical protein
MTTDTTALLAKTFRCVRRGGGGRLLPTACAASHAAANSGAPPEHLRPCINCGEGKRRRAELGESARGVVRGPHRKRRAYAAHADAEVRAHKRKRRDEPSSRPNDLDALDRAAETPPQAAHDLDRGFEVNDASDAPPSRRWLEPLR